MTPPPTHYYLSVYNVVDQPHHDEHMVTIQFEGSLRPATKKAILEAIQGGNFQLVEKKKVLA